MWPAMRVFVSCLFIPWVIRRHVSSSDRGNRVAYSKWTKIHVKSLELKLFCELKSRSLTKNDAIDGFQLNRYRDFVSHVKMPLSMSFH